MTGFNQSKNVPCVVVLLLVSYKTKNIVRPLSGEMLTVACVVSLFYAFDIISVLKSSWVETNRTPLVQNT